MPDKHPQFVLDILPSADLSEDAFVVGQANRTAYQAVKSWPHWAAPVMAIVGPAGAGKTHLGSLWAEQAGARLLPLELLAERHIKDRLSSPLCLDAGSANNVRHEDVLFHALNIAKEEAGSVLILSQIPPARWRVALPDLASRLKAIPVVEIDLPDDALLAEVLAKNFTDMGLKVSPAVVSFLTSRMERDYAAATNIAKTLGERSLAEKRAVTIPFARKILAELSVGA